MNTSITIEVSALRALLATANPNLEPAELDRLLEPYACPGGTGPGKGAPKTPKRQIQPVATAVEALRHAYRLSLVSVALRPTLSRQSTSQHWVINFAFSQWEDALSFTNTWAEKIGIKFHIQRNEHNFYVSLPLVAPPKQAKELAISVKRHGLEGLKSFAAALAGLHV